MACYIKIRFSLILIDKASVQVTDYFTSRKKEGTIQYGYRTWGTDAGVFSQTLTHRNSKNEIRQRDKDGEKRGMSMERSKAGTNKRSPVGLSHPNENTIIITEYCSAVWCSAADTHLKLLDRAVSSAWFLTGDVFDVTFSSSICGSPVYAV